MSLRLTIVQLYCPVFLKKQKLAELINHTAQAFQIDPPDLSRKSLDEYLMQFALFTQSAAEKILQSTNLSHEEVKKNLYRHTFQLGQKIRKQLGIRNFEEVLNASRFLYNLLGIDFKGDQNGEIIINKCYFSQFYSSQVCELISGLDEGMLAALSGGGRLTFFQRITEGNDCCKATLTYDGKNT